MQCKPKDHQRMNKLRGIFLHRSDSAAARCKLLVMIAAVCCSAMAEAASRCSKGSEFEPPLCPLVLPKIASITVEENAAGPAVAQGAAADNAVDCKRFRLTPAQVRRYLSLARATNASDAHYTLDVSPCYASGTLVFKDGKTGRWRLDMLRTGSITIGDAEPGVTYCPRCKYKPFDW
jgi:hypothetical protein